MPVLFDGARHRTGSPTTLKSTYTRIRCGRPDACDLQLPALRRFSRPKVSLAVRSTARVDGSAEQCRFGRRPVRSLLRLVERAEANFAAACEAQALSN
jgi:hypothetical protein